MDTVGAFTSSPVLSTNPDALAYDAAREMFEKKVGALLVKDNGKYVGIFTKADWMHKVLKWEGNPVTIKVASVMTTPIITVEKDEPLAKASLLMERNGIRHIAVMDKEKIVGMISIKDLERYFRKLYGIEL